MTDAVVFTTVKDVFLCSVTKTSMGHSFDKILHMYFKIITMYLLKYTCQIDIIIKLIIPLFSFESSHNP